MINKLIFSFLLSVIPAFAFAQIKIAGKIIDFTTRQAIEYANIGFPEKGVGTVANAQGNFELLISNELSNSLLHISHLGYETSTINLANSAADKLNLTIELKPAATNLPEITIIASKQTSLGFKPNNITVNGFFKAAGLGMEGGTLIQNQGRVVLSQFNLNILQIPFDSLKFRLNFYSVKKGKPSAKINSKDIIFSVLKSNTGLFSLSLERENVQVDGDFVCSIELIELYGQAAENAAFLFSAIPNKDGVIFKKAISMGSWEKVKKYSLCFWLTGSK